MFRLHCKPMLFRFLSSGVSRALYNQVDVSLHALAGVHKSNFGVRVEKFSECCGFVNSNERRVSVFGDKVVL
jgi:hypothetical protein